MSLSKKDKQDIKEVFIEALEPFAKAIQKDFQGVHAEFKTTHEEIRGLGIRLEDSERKWKLVAEQYLGIAQRVKDIDSRLDHHSTQFAELKVLLKIVKEDIESLKSGKGANFDMTKMQDLEKRVAALEKARK